jgi:multiple sugar transport system permease protein
MSGHMMLRAGRGRTQALTAYIFLAPAFIGLLVFTLVPFVASFYYSLTDYNVLSAAVWRGLGNYEKIFQSKVFWTALWNTFYYTIGTIPPKMVIGLVLAILLNRGLRAISIFRAIYYLPVVTATVAVSVIWLWIYNPSYGLANMILDMLHIPDQTWLLNPKLALPSLMILGIWKYIGSVMIIYLAGLQGIPEMYYEAASIDGANRWQQFRHITLPLLQPATFFNFVTLAITSFQVFEQMYVMTDGGPGYATTTMVYEIYREAFERFHMGYASALAVILFLIVFVLTLINFKFGGSTFEY